MYKYNKESIEKIAKKIKKINPNKFFKGKKVIIKLKLNNNIIKAAFYYKNNKVFFKSNFSKISHLVANIKYDLEKYSEEIIYNNVVDDMIPYGINMIINDHKIK